MKGAAAFTVDDREAAAFLRWEILSFIKVYGMDRMANIVDSEAMAVENKKSYIFGNQAEKCIHIKMRGNRGRTPNE